MLALEGRDRVAEQDAILAPWVIAPYSLVSWWDMERFSADQFFEISRILERFRGAEILNDNSVGPFSPLVSQWLPDLQIACAALGLGLSVKLISRNIEQLSRGIVKMSDWQKAVPEIQSRIRDEMEDRMCMYIPPARAERYDLAEPFGEQVSQSFPSCVFDAREAGNCFASGRFTASVFHLMRVLEGGLVAFASLFPAVPTDKENWHQIIEKIESEIRSMPQVVPKVDSWKEKQEKYSQLASNFMFFKDAWRNYTAHIRGKYTEDESDAIYRNVRSFMQGLASQGISE